jgi:hypothetical protein
MARSYEDRQVTTKRLTDKHDRPKVKLLDREGDIGDMRSPRDLAGRALAAAMSSRIKRHHVVVRGQPASRFAPLTCMTSQTMQEQDRPSRATEVQAPKTRPVSLKQPPGSHIRFAPYRDSCAVRARTP